MKKMFNLFLVLFVGFFLASCSSPSINNSKPNSFVEFDFGVNSKNEIKGDTNNFANISGTVKTGENVYLIDSETGIVHGSAAVSDGYFELSVNMSGLDNQKLTFTNEEVDFPVVEDVSTINQKVDLVFFANSASDNVPEESAIEEEIEVPEEVDEEVNQNVYKLGEVISFSSPDGDAIDLAINKVEKYAGDDWHTPEGLFYAKVTFTLTNNGKSEFSLNSHDFEFYDDQGFKSELNSKDYFSESVQPGKSVSGIAYYDVANDGESFEVYFADSSWIGTYSN